jgi:hypothetical protein
MPIRLSALIAPTALDGNSVRRDKSQQKGIRSRMGITYRTRRTLGAVAVMLGAAAGVSAIPSAGAFAATTSTTVRPMSATGCNDNVCIYLAGNSGGTALIQAWARNSSFYGHFTLSGPSVNQSSPTQTWKGNKGNYWSTSVNNAKAGAYCVDGYTSGGSYEGGACESLK